MYTENSEVFVILIETQKWYPILMYMNQSDSVIPHFRFDFSLYKLTAIA